MINDKMVNFPKMNCKYLGEPLLSFGNGGQHIDPRSGILQFGPKSYKPEKRHPSRVRVGFIGSAETIELAKTWMQNSAEGVLGDEKYPKFPGFKKECGFFSELEFDDDWISQLTQTELKKVLKISKQRDQFEELIALLESKLELLATKDLKADYVIVALPTELVSKCKVADYNEPKMGNIHRDLRRAFKAMAMKYRIPTQLVKETTINGKSKDIPSKIAWNFFTGLYFKAGGLPWGPVGLQPGTCYIGIGFYRSLGSALSTMQTSLVQAFDEHGDGLVLRGHEFTWDSEKEGTKSPHLTEEQAERLVKMVLDRYQKEMKQTPKRVVVHKTSRYWPAEREGFESVLEKYVSQYDLMALTCQNQARLLISNQYPPLRSTRFSIGNLDYLYTTGFIAELEQFHGMHVPSPIEIADHIGSDTPRETLLKDILILTKMNFNSSRLGGLLPITLRFSKLVGDIMREIPSDREPLPNFKFYV